MAPLTGPQKKQEMRMRIFRYVKFLPFVAILIALILFGANLKNISFEQLVHFSPDNYLLAVLFFMGIYALKSVSVIFPLVAIYLAAGVVFPTSVRKIVAAIPYTSVQAPGVPSNPYCSIAA